LAVNNSARISHRNITKFEDVRYRRKTKTHTVQNWTAPIVFQSLCGIPLGLFKLIVRFLGPSERNPGKADET
jgi:hypothetical protein